MIFFIGIRMQNVLYGKHISKLIIDFLINLTTNFNFIVNNLIEGYHTLIDLPYIRRLFLESWKLFWNLLCFQKYTTSKYVSRSLFYMNHIFWHLADGNRARSFRTWVVYALLMNLMYHSCIFNNIIYILRILADRIM